MICKSCGIKLKDDSLICSKCGTKVILINEEEKNTSQKSNYISSYSLVYKISPIRIILTLVFAFCTIALWETPGYIDSAFDIVFYYVSIIGLIVATIISAIGIRQKVRTINCPYCNSKVNVSAKLKDNKGINCDVCNKRILILNNKITKE